MTKQAALAPFSLDDLDASVETPYEFEYEMPNGEMSGVWISVLGAQNPIVVAETERLLDDRRRREGMAAMRAAKSGRNDEPSFLPLKDEREFSFKLAAVRVAGWRKPGETSGLTDEQTKRFRGLDAPFSPENALRLVSSNRHISEAVTRESNEVGHFMKASRAAS